MTSSSEDDMSRPSKPGTDRSSSQKTARSLRWLKLMLEVVWISGNIRNAHSCHTLVFWSIIIHSLHAVHEKRLYIAEGVDCPAKMTPMVY